MEAIKKVFIYLSVIIASLFINTGLHAQENKEDVVYLKNGSIIRGRIVEIVPAWPDDIVKIETRDGSLFFCEFNEIEKIEKKKAKTDKEMTCRDANKMTGNFNFFLGKKFLDESHWEPLDEHTEWGILLDIKQGDSPLSLAIDLLYSEDDASGFLYIPALGTSYAEGKLKTTELDFGFRKIWDNSQQVRPFIGGGIAFIKTELEGSAFGVTVSDGGKGSGWWIGGGVYWILNERTNLGLNLRWSKADVTLFDTETDVEGEHFGLMFGYHFN